MNTNKDLDEALTQYMLGRGSVLLPSSEHATLQPDLAIEFADWYQDADHIPGDFNVRSHYHFFKRGTMAQWETFIEAGFHLQPYTGEGEPYRDSRHMIEDITQNKHLWIFMTDKGFGEGDLPEDHPMLEYANIEINGMQLRHNDVFRAVHDLVGHAFRGNSFGPKGEFRAWIDHARTYLRFALPAMTNETFAQSSWFNFGPHLRRDDGSLPQPGDEDFIPLSKRPFSPQKANIVPAELLGKLTRLLK